MKYRIHKTPQFTIYFGDAALSVSLEEIDKKEITPALQNIAQELHISQLVFLHQNHGVQGNIVQRSDTQSQFFQQPGDYLITQKKDWDDFVARKNPVLLKDPKGNLYYGSLHNPVSRVSDVVGTQPITVDISFTELGDPEDLQVYAEVV